jgi:BppU N-terminal domain
MSDFQIKRGDLLPTLVITLLDANGATVDLTSASGAKLAIRIIGSTTPLVYADMVIDNQIASKGQVHYDWQEGDTDTPGEYQAEVVVNWGGKEQTFPTVGFITITIEDDLETHTPPGFSIFSTVARPQPRDLGRPVG